jgi:hypothetical protein
MGDDTSTTVGGGDACGQKLQRLQIVLVKKIRVKMGILVK